MFILKKVKVLCFDTLLQVLILKGVRIGDDSSARAGEEPGSAAPMAISRGEITQRGTVLGEMGGHRNLQMRRNWVDREFLAGGVGHF